MYESGEHSILLLGVSTASAFLRPTLRSGRVSGCLLNMSNIFCASGGGVSRFLISEPISETLSVVLNVKAQLASPRDVCVGV